ncbi:hypothetical protein PAESOLCIP111_01532 [Paenibacillus solanacearum]|uniref:Uncharacterized protein n=1 Tax=Paenibacillus solanacearum TaxID=2048548 RepID=A0A916JX90_9BACL|nr:hypothetical protein PAESOLCIP111_01532 [Paenibacillus solanacearum]
MKSRVGLDETLINEPHEVNAREASFYENSEEE